MLKDDFARKDMTSFFPIRQKEPKNKKDGVGKKLDHITSNKIDNRT